MARIRHEWIPQIRKMHAAGATVEALARYFGVSPAEIRCAIKIDDPQGRCPDCGRPSPCVACAAQRRFFSQPPGSRPSDAAGEPLRLGIGLRGEHRVRYLAIRAEKICTCRD